MRPPSVQVGEKYGRLTVIKFAGIRRSGKQNLRLFRCRCACGKSVTVQGRLLKSGNSQSCGCQLKAYRKSMLGSPKSKHAPGERFNRLKLLRWHHTHKKKAYFEFECDCGLVVVRSIQSVLQGKVNSCGCLRSEMAREMGRKWSYLVSHGKFAVKKADGDAARKKVFHNYRGDARRRGLQFLLSFVEFRQMTASDCHYCGQPPNTLGRNKTSTCLYNGLDRVNNDEGYTSTNTVPCCPNCNRSKHTRTKSDFIAWARSIAKRHP